MTMETLAWAMMLSSYTSGAIRVRTISDSYVRIELRGYAIEIASVENQRFIRVGNHCKGLVLSSTVRLLRTIKTPIDNL